MSLTINAPGVEGRLRREAARKGVSAADLAATILSDHLADAPSPAEAAAPFYDTASPEEWNAEFDAWIQSHEGGVSLPESAMTRESFYEVRA